MQVVQSERRGVNGKLVKDTDPCGGVFTPVPGQRLRPAYSIGPATAKTREVMFQCPVSAIPDEAFSLLFLWWKCRLLKALPMAGGFLDQPVMVQRAFPVFEVQMQQAEGDKGAGGPERAAALAVGAMVQLMGGGGRGR